MRGAHAPAVTLWLAALVALLLCDAAPSGTLRDTQAQTERGAAAESSQPARATPPLLTPRYHLVPDAVSSQDISAPIAVHNGTHLVWHIFVDVVPRNRQPRDPARKRDTVLGALPQRGPRALDGGPDRTRPRHGT